MPDVSRETAGHDGSLPGRTAGAVRRAVPAGAVGLAAACAAVGAGELVAAFTGPAGAPVLAVGSAAIDLTPTPLKEYAVRTFGTNDKPVLIGGILLTVAALAVLAGLLAARRPAVGAAVFAAFGAVGAWAALSRPESAGADALPALAAGAVGAAAVYWLGTLLRARRAAAADGRAAEALVVPVAREVPEVPEGTAHAGLLGAGPGETASTTEVVELPEPPELGEVPGEVRPGRSAADAGGRAGAERDGGPAADADGRTVGEGVDAASATVAASAPAPSASGGAGGAGGTGDPSRADGPSGVGAPADGPSGAGPSGSGPSADGPSGVGVAPRPGGPSRRAVLLATAGTALLGLGAGYGGRVIGERRGDVSALRDAVRLPAPAVRARPLPAGVHPDVPGLSPFLTSNQDFYRVDTALTVPRIDPRRWSLRLHGLVDRPLELSYEELLRLPLEELDHTLSCVSNEVGGPYVSTTRWLGASLPALLRRAGVRPGADQLVGRSREGMTIGTPLASVLDGRPALLAVAMDGEPLPLAHGFPCRTVVPGFYGYTSATKWLVDLEVTTFAARDPYWVRRGWDRTGEVRTASRIEVPAPFAKVPAGDVTVAGTAWATHRGVAAVELRVDGGPWAEAELAADAGPDLWRQWSHTWRDARPGTHRLEVRATDGTGTTQPEARATPYPSGATGWHSTVVRVT
ncbi:molybdopterin-dependent oxidoreductase [Kitasatospora sp. NPDC051853]|uniref:molybdopterin-dependent oxidoreductase n=1 Tax=Kitasatospora sp. NPDC051853 TaxID=3364058 RepID=UPI0037B3797A